MKEILIRNTIIGKGIPKICVPIVSSGAEGILEQARIIRELDCEMAEWRMDWYEDILQEGSAARILKELRNILGEKIIIATFRTQREGGKHAVDFYQYERINLAAAETGCADFIDVEIFSFGEIAESLIHALHEKGVKVIASNHDFKKTPPKEELVTRLLRMQSLGADIPKIAVMPQSPQDVLTLLEATEEMVRCHGKSPIITMSMAGMGGISRITGELFGSAVTFASAGKASAPGQIPINKLKRVLDLLHESL